MLKKLLYCTGFLFAWILWNASWAQAADLNLVASEVARKQVSVHCERSDPQWREMVRQVAPNADSTLVNAYTLPGIPTAFLSPRACRALSQPTVEDAGYSEFSLALLALAHEAVHQRGVLDEAQTECLAMPLVKSLAIKHFGVKPKVYRYVKSGKLWKRTLVANPALSRIAAFVKFWHTQKPQHYQGGC